MNIVIIISIILLIVLIVNICILIMFVNKYNKDVFDMNSNLNNKEIENLKNINDLKYSFNENILKSFSSVSERLVKIDEAQKNIDKLSVNIFDLQKVLSDKKIRGVFGEIQLTQILLKVFGENSQSYAMQYKMQDNKIVDAAIFAPEPFGLIPIDAKFPLENYNKIFETDAVEFKKAFVRDVKKHINDISEKYIKIQSVNQAIIFIPAEAIFSYIVSDDELLNYSYDKKVWIASPTTLMSVLTSIQMVILNSKRNEMAQKLHNELLKLDIEFSRYKDRWEKLVKDVDKMTMDIKDVSITSQKLQKVFEDIKNGKI